LQPTDVAARAIGPPSRDGEPTWIVRVSTRRTDCSGTTQKETANE
jgi:hypothetical protein